MAQLPIKKAIENSVEELLSKHVLPAIVAYMAQKGVQSSVTELSKVLEMSETSVSTNNTPRQNNIPIGMVGSNGSNGSTPPAVKQTRKKVNGGATCKFILQKSRDRNGQPCGKPEHFSGYCKACLRKRLVVAELAKTGVTQQQISIALGESQSAGISNNTGPNTPTNDMNTQEFIPVDGHPNIFLHTPTNLICERFNGKFIAVALTENKSAVPLNAESIQAAIKYGFEYKSDQPAPSAPSAPTPVPAPPHSEMVPPPPPIISKS